MKSSAMILTILLSVAVSSIAIGQEQTSQQPAKSKVTQRQINQQRRIKQGVRNGQLTRGETKRLEKQQGRIQEKKRIDKAENGGKLTPKDKAQLNRMQNRASRNIYRKKHNARVQN